MKIRHSEPMKSVVLSSVEQARYHPSRGDWCRGTLQGQGRYDEAEELVVKAEETARRAFGGSRKITSLGVENLIELREGWNKPEKAEEWRAKLPERQAKLL